MFVSFSLGTCPSNTQADGSNRKLKKSAIGVLASLRSSTYPRGYASGSSLAAALLDGLFEHPVGEAFSSIPRCEGNQRSAVPQYFFRSLLGVL
jgi:hypothetical protein